MSKLHLLFAALLLAALQCPAQAVYNWTNLPAAPTNGGKQDGIFFLNKDTGWVVNGSGLIYRTVDGGAHWRQQLNAAGTYFRAIAFKDAQTGFAANVGTNYFPGVTDSHPLYKSVDGGSTWAAVTNITGAVPAGICAIQVVDPTTIYAAGRVGSPPVVIKSTDGGATWSGTDLSAHCQMILDIWFHSRDTGYVFAGSAASAANSSALILRTTDGGASWAPVYTSARTNEIIWKAAFPSHNVGYATIQSYDANTTQRYVAKTTDGGLTWTELPLANSGVREFGIGFISESTGWVGGESTGYETRDGGQTWTPVNLGKYANKFAVIKNSDGSNTCYASGLNVYKLDTRTAAAIGTATTVVAPQLIFPNPVHSGAYLSVALDQLGTPVVAARIFDSNGRPAGTLFDGAFTGTGESPFYLRLPVIAAGNYVVKFYGGNGKLFSAKLTVAGD